MSRYCTDKARSPKAGGSSPRAGHVTLVDAGARGVAATGDLSAAAKRLSGARSGAQARAGSSDKTSNKTSKKTTGSVRREPRDAAEPGVSSSARRHPADAPRTGTGRSRRAALMRYASDSKLVQAVYTFTTGRYRFASFALVAALVVLGVYSPARSLYVSYRTHEILSKQMKLRGGYNDQLQAEVDKLLSQDGIEQAARENLGMVKPGEKKINILGDQDTGQSGSGGADKSGSTGKSTGSSSAAGHNDSDSGADDDVEAGAEPANAGELMEDEREVDKDAPWYIKALDEAFFFNGSSGETISSSGA